jgi:hypothetical protein
MAWSNSKVFRPFVADVLGNTAAFDLDADTIKSALYDNDITPDQNVTAANSAYNVGQWAISGNEVSETTNWPAGGIALTSKSVNAATAATVFFDAADTPSATSTTTLANVYGCLNYDDTLTTPVADQGICFNYFGGVQSVTAGLFTIVWHANGIFTIAL